MRHPGRLRPRAEGRGEDRRRCPIDPAKSSPPGYSCGVRMTITFWLIECCDYESSTPIGLRSNLSQAIDDVEREFGMLEWDRRHNGIHVSSYSARLAPGSIYSVYISPIDLDGPLDTDLLRLSLSNERDLLRELADVKPLVGSTINFPQLANVEGPFVSWGRRYGDSTVEEGIATLGERATSSK